MSFLFNEIDFNKALKENSKNIRVKKQISSKNKDVDSKPKFFLAKVKKGEMTLTVTARLTKFDG